MLSYKELQLRAALFHAVRRFFIQHHFLETDTPVRQPVIIPESNIQPISSGNCFLQTSPELYMKRLLASGCSRIFQICKCFRKEEKGRHHLEEFTMLEWYRTEADYNALMQDCENLVISLQQQLSGHLKNLYREGGSLLFSADDFSLSSPWQRISVAESFDSWSPVSLEQALEEGTFDEVLVEYIEPMLGVDCPTFLVDYPVSMASLARKKREDQQYSERFELYIKGVELANGFSELTDPVEQRSRFAAEIGAIEKKGSRQAVMPETFLNELGNIGEAAGIAFGLDRLFMLILGKDAVGQAVTFSPDDY